jgi:hypothetical protein
MELHYQIKTEPLIPGAKRGRWRSGGIESADRDFVLIRPKALQRDSNRCQQCGMEMDGMHVHHKNDDHSVNELKNLETREDLCHAVSHVGNLGKSGAMVHLDISQRDLSHLYRTIAIAVNMGGEWAKKAMKIHEALMLGRAPVQTLFGTSNPGDFGNALTALTDEDYSKRRVPLEGVRVIFKPTSLTSLGTRAAKKTPGIDMWERIADEQLTVKNEKNDDIGDGKAESGDISETEKIFTTDAKKLNKSISVGGGDLITVQTKQASSIDLSSITDPDFD